MGKKLVRLKRSVLQARRRAMQMPVVPAPPPMARFESVAMEAKVTGQGLPALRGSTRPWSKAGVPMPQTPQEVMQHGRTAVMKQTRREAQTALRMLMWKLQYDSLGVAGRTAQGTEKEVDRLVGVLEANDVDFDTLKRLTSRQLIQLYTRLELPPMHRLWLAALLRARPCGAILYSQDGKHVCMREAMPGHTRCGDPQHAEDYVPVTTKSKAPLPGATRAAFRQYYGRSTYPVYEVYDEHAMNARVEKHYPEHTIDTVGPAVQMVENLHAISVKHESLGSDPDTVGGEEDMERALVMWSVGQAEGLDELMARHAVERALPTKSAVRTYEVTLLRGEFDRGGPGEYRRKVQNRSKEWRRWLMRLQRALQDELEKCGLSGQLQTLEAPRLDQMQAAVDREEQHARDGGPPQHMVRPSPLELRNPADGASAAERLLRPLDPSRAVTAADLLPVMPTVVVRGTVTLAKPSRPRSKFVGQRVPRMKRQRGGGGALDLSLKVLISNDACFTRSARTASSLKAALAALPLPPAMIPFNALFRVDPLDRVLEMQRHNREVMERRIALAAPAADGTVTYIPQAEVDVDADGATGPARDAEDAAVDAAAQRLIDI